MDGLPTPIHRFVHIWLFPANGYEGMGEIRLVDRDTGESPGWMGSRMATAGGNATLFGVEGREAADNIYRLFAEERELVFSVRFKGEDLLSLPMPNERGLQESYQQIVEQLRAS